MIYLDDLPSEVMNRFHSRLNEYGLEERQELLLFINARSGKLSAIKNLVYSLLTQAVDETSSEKDQQTFLEFQDQFENTFILEGDDYEKN